MNASSEIMQAALAAARALVEQFEINQSDRLVIAESCTGGLVSGLLAQVPGVSQWLCGSAVTYRGSVKKEWLGVSETTLATCHAESIETTSEMALGVLRQTSEANFSVAITGHLGPGAPPATDGQVFIAVAVQAGEVDEIYSTHQLKLDSHERVLRQYESAVCLLDVTRKAIAEASSV
jgi:PncC family amidohydrolase